MRCERCKFENIPGTKICIRCGSVLELAAEQINIYPPRMFILKKPFRDLQRLLRKSNIIPQKSFFNLHLPQWFANIFDDYVLGLILSIIPGLAHIIQKRFKEIRWYLLAWLVFLLAGLFLYGSQVGYFFLGLAVGAHTGIAFQYKILKDMESTPRKLIVFLVILIGFIFLYRFAIQNSIPNLNGVHSTLTIPYQKIENGDYLLAWRNNNQTNLKRGDLVLIHPVMPWYHQKEIARNKQHTAVQLVGLPGEKLEIKNNCFIANSRQLDTGMYPVPQWLQKMEFTFIIPENSYFVNVQYNVNAHNMALDAGYISNVCIIKASDIESKVFMLWSPLMKRSFIR